MDDINIKTYDQNKESVNQEDEYKFDENIISSENKSKNNKWKLNESFPAPAEEYKEEKDNSKNKQIEEKEKDKNNILNEEKREEEKKEEEKKEEEKKDNNYNDEDDYLSFDDI